MSVYASVEQIIIKENRKTLNQRLSSSDLIIPPRTLAEKIKSKLHLFYSALSDHLEGLKVTHTLMEILVKDVVVHQYLEVNTREGKRYFDIHGQHLELNTILNRYGLNKESSQYNLIVAEIQPKSDEIEDMLFAEEALLHYLLG